MDLEHDQKRGIGSAFDHDHDHVGVALTTGFEQAYERSVGTATYFMSVQMTRVVPVCGKKPRTIGSTASVTCTNAVPSIMPMIAISSPVCGSVQPQESDAS